MDEPHPGEEDYCILPFPEIPLITIGIMSNLQILPGFTPREKSYKSSHFREGGTSEQSFAESNPHLSLYFNMIFFGLNIPFFHSVSPNMIKNC